MQTTIIRYTSNLPAEDDDILDTVGSVGGVVVGGFSNRTQITPWM